MNSNHEGAGVVYTTEGSYSWKRALVQKQLLFRQRPPLKYPISWQNGTQDVPVPLPAGSQRFQSDAFLNLRNK